MTSSFEIDLMTTAADTFRHLLESRKLAHLAAINGVLLLHHLVCDARISKHYKTKPARPASRPVLHDDRIDHLAIRLKILLQALCISEKESALIAADAVELAMQWLLESDPDCSFCGWINSRSVQPQDALAC